MLLSNIRSVAEDLQFQGVEGIYDSSAYTSGSHTDARLGPTYCEIIPAIPPAANWETCAMRFESPCPSNLAMTRFAA